MFREVGLAVKDRDLHRFFHENSDGLLQEWRMTRVTFGITSSPFLASKVLLQIAEDHVSQFPEAAAIVRNAFYVDNCLTGTSSLDEANKLRRDLNTLVSLGKFTLRKWRSSSSELLDLIPAELKEETSRSHPLSVLRHSVSIGTPPQMFCLFVFPISLNCRSLPRESCHRPWASYLMCWDGSPIHRRLHMVV